MEKAASMTAGEPLPLIRVHDLRDSDARQAAHRHRGFWGKLYTDIHLLDTEHVALIFRPAPDEHWRPWEAARLRLIMDQHRQSGAGEEAPPEHPLIAAARSSSEPGWQDRSSAWRTPRSG